MPKVRVYAPHLIWALLWQTLLWRSSLLLKYKYDRKKVLLSVEFFWETLKRAKFRNAFGILLGNWAEINFKIYYLNKIMQTILPQKCYTYMYIFYISGLIKRYSWKIWNCFFFFYTKVFLPLYCGGATWFNKFSPLRVGGFGGCNCQFSKSSF